MMSANTSNVGRCAVLGAPGVRRQQVPRRLTPAAFKEGAAPGEPVRRAGEGASSTAVLEPQQGSLFLTCEEQGVCESFDEVRSCSCCKEDLENVKRMVKDGANLDAVDATGNTLLSLATDCGYHELVEELVNAGASVDVPSGRLQRTPMQQAAHYGYRSLVEYFLRRGASTSAIDEYGNTALALAYASGHYDVAEILEIAGKRH